MGIAKFDKLCYNTFMKEIVEPTLFDSTEATPAPTPTPELTLDQRIAAMAASGDRRNRDTAWDPNEGRELPGWTKSKSGSAVTAAAVETPSVPKPAPADARVKKARKLGVEIEHLDPTTHEPLSPHDLYDLR